MNLAMGRVGEGEGARPWLGRLLLGVLPVLVAVAGVRLPESIPGAPPPAVGTAPVPEVLPSLRLKGESLLHSLPEPEVAAPVPVEVEPEPELFPLPEVPPLRRARSDAVESSRALPQAMESGEGREEEGARLLAQGSPQRAEAVWRQALERTPERLSLRRRLARLLVAQGQDDAARSLLEASPQGRLRDWRGMARSDADAAALLAALYHKAQRPWESVALYEALLTGDNRAGVWWLGLALALEQGGEPGEALVAYRAALADERLGREARQFVRQRLHNGGVR